MFYWIQGLSKVSWNSRALQESVKDVLKTSAFQTFQGQNKFKVTLRSSHIGKFFKVK